MEQGLISDILGSHWHLLATIYVLFKGVGVHDDTNCGTHKNDVSLLGVVQIVCAIICSVAVNVLDLKLKVWLGCIKLDFFRLSTCFCLSV